MLPGFLGGRSERRVGTGRGIGEGAPDLTEDRGGGNGVCPGIGVVQQWRGGVAAIRGGGPPAGGPPEPIDAGWLRGVGGGGEQAPVAPPAPPPGGPPAAAVR